ncbi:hypothetical protein F383_36120 [Gossypium arboreum]|uniref:Uncharacterized protein n=1 Tax=Gossypium arboreum TaxID=29729 RepID=A0A0B0NCY9_GOSAR|nr:hypothetical protein F383_36120 [Gossypium arboreum]
MFYANTKASSDLGIVGDYVTLSNHHFGTFELMVWSYGMYRIMVILIRILVVIFFHLRWLMNGYVLVYIYSYETWLNLASLVMYIYM